MKRPFSCAALLLAIVVAFPGGGPISTAAPVPQEVEDSLIDVWVFIDNDRDGVYSFGDVGLSDAWVYLFYKDLKLFSLGASDLGDLWWEIRPEEGTRFVVRIDTTSPVLEGLSLLSIRCEDTRTREEYRCAKNLELWTTRLKMPYGTRLNIFYALAPAE
jgi:hypothetical protein